MTLSISQYKTPKAIKEKLKPKSQCDYGAIYSESQWQVLLETSERACINGR